jgi:anthranilate phosphoribosyltransferase
MNLAPLIRAMGRGPSRARSLTREEAREAMGSMLSGQAAPEAVGALLMLMRYRGETAPEIAGMAEALRATLPDWRGLDVALDWPSYAAGRSRGLPWFLLAAKLVARTGRRVALHGWNSHQAQAASVRGALPGLGIAMVSAPDDLALALARDAIAYVPLETLSPDGYRLLSLREVLGLRSCINTVLRVANPMGARAAVQGVFHPPYRGLQADAGALLGQENLLILKGAGGEFERHPSKEVELFGRLNGVEVDLSAHILRNETRRLADPNPDPDHLAALWEGRRDDPFAEDVVTGTAALALLALGEAPTLAEAEARAQDLWQERPRA